MQESRSLIVVAQFNKVSQVWDSTTLQCMRTLEGHEDNVRVLAFGNRYLFSGGSPSKSRPTVVLCLHVLNTVAHQDH